MNCGRKYGLFSRIYRWWRGKGFGVHSPFAFRFIIDVLCQRYAYYGYSDIEAQRRASGLSRREAAEARLILRLAARSHRTGVYIAGSIGELARVAISESRLPIVDTADSGSLILWASGEPIDMPEGSIALFDGRWSGSQAAGEECWQSIVGGMRFCDKDTAVVVKNAKLPRQEYAFLLR